MTDSKRRQMRICGEVTRSSSLIQQGTQYLPVPILFSDQVYVVYRKLGVDLTNGGSRL
jgi:hypothetical protein